MAYHVGVDEPVDETVRRICREQLETAKDELTDTDADIHEGVHEARKAFKKIRAALRLVRPALGEVYRRENVWFRDEARTLSHVRDATALIETVDGLSETCPEQMDAGLRQRVRQAFLDRREDLASDEVDLQERVEDLVAAIDDASARVDGWTLDDSGFEAIGPGFAKSYRRGRSALADVQDSPTETNIHELRKRVKDHRYHVQILAPLWPAVLEGLVEAIHDLSDLLGEHQNLHVLRETLRNEPTLLEPSDAEALLAILHARQADLRRLAVPLAGRVYAEKPKHAVARFAAYWEVWTTGNG